jgi:hypothetical protein
MAAQPEEITMRIRSIAAALSCALVGFAITAAAEERFVRFEGGIGLVPVSSVATANTVRGNAPGGQPWVISRLSVDIGTSGSVSVDGRGLLLGGGDNIGTNGGQSVRARLLCGTAAHDSPTVALEPNGDFRIEGTLTPWPPTDACATPVLLIMNGAGTRWFAAGIRK